jgi:hypothetical protein
MGALKGIKRPPKPHPNHKPLFLQPHILKLKMFFLTWMLPQTRRIGKWSEHKRGTLFWKSPRYLASQTGETWNMSSLGQEELLDHMNDPLARGTSIRPCSEIKSKNSIIAGERQVTPNLLQGKRMTLKSPPMHQGESHQLSKLANSSHKDLRWLSRLGPYTPTKAQVIYNISKRAGHNILLHTHLNLFHNPPISHQQDATGSPTRRKIAQIKKLAPPKASHNIVRNKLHFSFLQAYDVCLPLPKENSDFQPLATLI